ncbi:MAG: IMP dehydrogenase [Chloroflexi bacterium]|nr:IMP dehydrogenase [Chloroflexota bacterium]
MKLRTDPGLTFDDVLLVPNRSGIRSRKDVSTETWLTRDIHLHIPIVSANMDTVTETRMAIAMAQVGGIGILHRFMSIERQAESVRRVKRAENMVVEQPLQIEQTATVSQARQKMAESDVGGLVVVDENRRLLGVVTTRDVLLAEDGQTQISSVMTPRDRLVVAGPGETMSQARLKLHEHRIEKLPLVDSEDRVIGLITAQDIVKIQDHPNATKDNRGRLLVGVALGARLSEDMARAEACAEAGADVFVVDIAHGHSEHTIEMVRQLKSRFPSIQVIAGNVATAAGVCDLAEAGADAVKVGIGAGSICITRIVTGFGVPQLTAIAECSEAGRKMGVPIIADGGIRNSGDMVKALAAGASSVMLGSMLAGTEESPGAPVVRDGRRYKVVRGMASLSANVERRSIDGKGEVADEDWAEVVPEGVEAVVPFRGAVADIIYQMVGGLRSGLSYAGARNIEELWEKAEFIRVTPAGQRESGPHDVSKI